MVSTYMSNCKRDILRIDLRDNIRNALYVAYGSIYSYIHSIRMEIMHRS